AGLSAMYVCFSFSTCYFALRALLSFPARRSSDLGRALLLRALADQLRADHALYARAGLPRGVAPRRRRVRSRDTHRPHEGRIYRSEEHTSELQSRFDLVCRLLLEKTNVTTSL